MDFSDERDKIAAALVKAQAGVRVAVKAAQGDKYMYAPLDIMHAAAKPALSEAGLAVSTSFEDVQTHAQVVTVTAKSGKSYDKLSGYVTMVALVTVLHESGQWARCRVPIIGDISQGPRSMGSLQTYARRYALTAILDMTTADDDGAQAMRQVGQAMSDDPSQPAPSKQYADGNLAKTGLRQEDAEKLVGAPFAQWGQAHVPTLRKLAETLRGARAVGVQESNSRPGTYHLQYTRGSGTLCTCEHFTYKKTCSHVKEQ